MSDDAALSNLTSTPSSAISGTVESHMTSSPAAVYLARRTAASRQTMATALKVLAELFREENLAAPCGEDQYLAFPWASLRRPQTLRLREKLRQRYAPATANKLLVALRGVLRVAEQLGQLTPDETAQALDIPPIPEQAIRHRRVLSLAELRALQEVCTVDTTPAGARDAALLMLLTALGLRRAEVTALDLADVNISVKHLVVRGGRGGVTRTVELPIKAVSLLEQWIAVRGEVPGPLFYGLVKGGGLVERRLAPQAVAIICAARAAEAGVPPFTPDDVRRTFLGADL